MSCYWGVYSWLFYGSRFDDEVEASKMRAQIVAGERRRCRSDVSEEARQLEEMQRSREADQLRSACMSETSGGTPCASEEIEEEEDEEEQAPSYNRFCEPLQAEADAFLGRMSGAVRTDLVPIELIDAEVLMKLELPAATPELPMAQAVEITPEVEMTAEVPTEVPTSPEVQERPSSIFHALHHTFDQLRRSLPELAARGFDAVQIAPAQLSPPGHLREKWYLRYQPLRYNEIDPALGGDEALRRLCEEASQLKMLVIADCVFNHMAVVATCKEWEAAQKDFNLLEALKQRIDDKFGPDLDRHDFQWPWVCLEGAKWDDPEYMYEGWGCGEWSELRFSEKVVELHLQHLDLLLSCGVRGFRLDAAKHMRPAHVKRYADYLEDKRAFVYVEVLSLENSVHSQYAPLPSTCFPLAAQLCQAWQGDGGEICARLRALDVTTSPGDVAFVRNHDTMLNEGPICGIEWNSAEDASLAWAYLIARYEGSVLLHEDDADTPAVQAALAFRAGLRAKLAEGDTSAELLAWPPPSYDLIMLLVKSKSGNCPAGLAAFNVSAKAVPLTLPWSLSRHHLQEVHGRAASDPMRAVPACSGRFFSIEPRAAGLDVKANWAVQPAHRSLTLFYLSAWDTPHLHFGVEGFWTSSPGWAFQRCEAPPGLPMLLAQAETPWEGQWWRMDVPLDLATRAIEFVPNDCGDRWDKPEEGKNYVAPAPGVYTLINGILQNCSEW
eukprot:TRINITY_DN31935_c0_g1_i1.p1 TRINITY_DN31935_c0_g1~~TRINITY_DN31935_c0_g1_i1.p1  ORF type:complete len:733 (+),score=145.54 TRINITY_DN31935_c0_g1_i1:31-2199(+)